MRTALRGVLAVDEREIALAVARAVGDGHLDVVARKVDRRIERLLGHVFVEQIQQAVFRNVAVAVEIERQPQVQVRIVAHHLLDVFEVVGILAEDLLVDAERDEGAVFLARRSPTCRSPRALGEGHRAGLAVAYQEQAVNSPESMLTALTPTPFRPTVFLKSRAAVLYRRCSSR